jgi:hypothetical protein
VNNKFCFVFGRRREEIQTVFFCQSGQHFCNLLYSVVTNAEKSVCLTLIFVKIPKNPMIMKESYKA